MIRVFLFSALFLFIVTGIGIFSFSARAATIAASNWELRSNCESVSVKADLSGVSNWAEVNGYLEWATSASGPWKRGSDIYPLHQSIIPRLAGAPYLAQVASKLLFAKPSTNYWVRFKIREGSGEYIQFPSDNNIISIKTKSCVAPVPQVGVIACVDGSDADNVCGNSACPTATNKCFNTIQSAIDLYSGTNGGVILIEDGEYYEALSVVDKYGSSGNPLVLRSMNQYGAKVRASNPNFKKPSWTIVDVNKGVYKAQLPGFNNVDYIYRSGLWFIDQAGNIKRVYEYDQAKGNSCSSTADCIYKVTNHGTALPAFHINNDVSPAEVYIRIPVDPFDLSRGYVNPQNLEFHFAVNETSLFIWRAGHIVIDGLAFQFGGREGSGGIKVVDGNNLFVQNSRFDGRGLYIGSNGSSYDNVVKNNIFVQEGEDRWGFFMCRNGSDCFDSALNLGGTRNMVAQDNVITGGWMTAIAATYGSVSEGHKWNLAYDFDVARNKIDVVTDCGIDTGGAGYLNAIWGNSIARLDERRGADPYNGGGLAFCQSPLDVGPQWVLYNTFSGDYTGGLKTGHGGGAGWSILAHNNFHYWNPFPYQKLYLSENDYILPLGNGGQDLGAASGLFVTYGWGTIYGDREFNHKNIINNIGYFKYRNFSFGTDGDFVPTPISTANFKVHHNNFYTPSDLKYTWLNENCNGNLHFNSLLSFQSESHLCGLKPVSASGDDGAEEGSFDSDPRNDWVDPNNINFRLKTGSRLIDAGALLYGININTPSDEFDFLGNAPDIGAVESSESGQNLPPQPPRGVRII